MNIINKYIWLINTLRRFKYGVTLEQIANAWYDSDLNVDHSRLNARTFARWKEAVQDKFGLIIECDRSDGYKYYIENESVLEQEFSTSWMLNTISISNVIEEFKLHKDKIILEKVCSGDEYLIPILQAIKTSRQLELVYHRFQEDAPRDKETINPLCVRFFNRKWYAVVDYVSCNQRRIICFDRIEELNPTENKYVYPKDFDAEEYFMYDYGIHVGTDDQPCIIRLKVNAQQRPYTRALPLHPSQKEIEAQNDYSIFEYYLKPTNDFARAILPFGMNYEVLEPTSLRDKVREMAAEIMQTNKK